MAKEITLRTRKNHSSIVVEFDLAECTNCNFVVPAELTSKTEIHKFIDTRLDENDECLIPTCGMIVHSHEEDFVPAGLTAFSVECGQGSKTGHLSEIIAGTGAPITTDEEDDRYIYVPTAYARGVLDAVDALSLTYVLSGSSMDLLLEGEMDAAVAAAYAELACTYEKGAREGAVAFKPVEWYPLGLLVQQLGAHGVEVEEEYERGGAALLVAENDAALATRVIRDLGGIVITPN
ncbi:hypothetical protein [Paeniglutamicibacter sp.]|uniref:hypothetical protein n=1 Tax=Paeniglutamicibacter sp. TaxID=1934391 RepID=UPI003988ACDC